MGSWLHKTYYGSFVAKLGLEDAVFHSERSESELELMKSCTSPFYKPEFVYFGIVGIDAVLYII